jgi:hypothetical protein
MNTPDANYPIDRWCFTFKRKRAAPFVLSLFLFNDANVPFGYNTQPG